MDESLSFLFELLCLSAVCCREIACLMSRRQKRRESVLVWCVRAAAEFIQDAAVGHRSVSSCLVLPAKALSYSVSANRKSTRTFIKLVNSWEIKGQRFKMLSGPT